MATKRCGCSGIRNCFLCEKIDDRKRVESYSSPSQISENHSTGQSCVISHFCLENMKLKQGHWQNCVCFCKSSDKIDSSKIYPNDTVDTISGLEFCLGDGIVILENFVSEKEELSLKDEVYKLPWKQSQSGRRKQDFGPQANFKRRKLKVGKFTGLPFFLQDIVKKLKSHSKLYNFEPVEVCHLEYSSERGSSIDPHIDDTWLWGERLVTLSLCSCSILTLSNESMPEVQVQVPMPQRSLIILQGSARHTWKHSIRREDINGIRLAITFRELSNEFTVGDKTNAGHEILQIASSFNGKPIFSSN